MSAACARVGACAPGSGSVWRGRRALVLDVLADGGEIRESPSPTPPTNPLSAHVPIHAPRPKRAGAYCQLFFKDRAQYLES